MRLIETPLLSIHVALNTEIKRLGYNCIWNVDTSTEAVLIDQMTLDNSQTVKDALDYDVSFLFDIITRSNNPVKSYQILENIRRNLNLAVEGFMIQDFTFEQCTALEELDEKGLIIRQLQRCRLKLT